MLGGNPTDSCSLEDPKPLSGYAELTSAFFRPNDPDALRAEMRPPPAAGSFNRPGNV